MKPICVKCQRFYRIIKNGYSFVEAMPYHGRQEPGTSQPDQWTPYKLWVGDLWQCLGCGHELVSGVAHEPLSEHYKPDFAALVKRHDATLQVNDC